MLVTVILSSSMGRGGTGGSVVMVVDVVADVVAVNRVEKVFLLTSVVLCPWLFSFFFRV